ncbi:MAG: response regulator [Kineosporiaceae bacterium]
MTPAPEPVVRVLVVDDHAAVRAGIAAVLGTAGDLRVVGEAGDGATAVRQARVLRPDVVVMDLRMPRFDGVEATRAVVAEGLADVLVLTVVDAPDHVLAAVRAGAAGFLLKTADAPTLVDAVRRVAAGEGVMAPEVPRGILDRVAATEPARREEPPGLVTLTTREQEVLAGLGRGASNARLAAELGIAEATVKTHVSRILDKLGCASRVEAALLARDTAESQDRGK